MSNFGEAYEKLLSTPVLDEESTTRDSQEASARIAAALYFLSANTMLIQSPLHEKCVGLRLTSRRLRLVADECERIAGTPVAASDKKVRGQNVRKSKKTGNSAATSSR
jgi:hypothetical protein